MTATIYYFLKDDICIVRNPDSLMLSEYFFDKNYTFDSLKNWLKDYYTKYDNYDDVAFENCNKDCFIEAWKEAKEVSK